MQAQPQLQTSFPENIYQVASEYQVGTPLKAYVRAIFKWQLVIVFIGVVFSAILLIFSIQQYSFDKRMAEEFSCPGCPASLQQQSNQENADALRSDVSSIVESAVQLVIFPAGLGLFLYVRRKWPVFLCSQGLLITTRKRTEAIRWDEVAEVYWRDQKMAFLRKADTEKGWDITRLQNAREIVAVVEREVVPRLLEQALAEYKKQGEVRFNCLLIRRDGLVNNSPAVHWSIDERVVSWSELEDIYFQDGAISVKAHDQWKRWDGGPKGQRKLASVVPNPMVYVALAQRLLKTRNMLE